MTESVGAAPAEAGDTLLPRTCLAGDRERVKSTAWSYGGSSLRQGEGMGRGEWAGGSGGLREGARGGGLRALRLSPVTKPPRRRRSRHAVASGASSQPPSSGEGTATQPRGHRAPARPPPAKTSEERLEDHQRRQETRCHPRPPSLEDAAPPGATHTLPGPDPAWSLSTSHPRRPSPAPLPHLTLPPEPPSPRIVPQEEQCSYLPCSWGKTWHELLWHPPACQSRFPKAALPPAKELGRAARGLTWPHIFPRAPHPEHQSDRWGQRQLLEGQLDEASITFRATAGQRVKTEAERRCDLTTRKLFLPQPLPTEPVTKRDIPLAQRLCRRASGCGKARWKST